MKIQKVTFKKKDLNKIPNNERIFLFQMLNLLTELNVLNKIMVSYLEKVENEIADKSIYCHKLFLTFISAGKLYEGWNILKSDYFESQASKTIDPQISKKGKENLKLLKKYFSKKSHLERIRNKFAFHSDSAELDDQFKKYNDNEPFEFYWSEYTSNCFSTTYFDLLKAVVSGIDTDENKGIQKTLKDIREKTIIFREYIEEVVQYFVGKYLDDPELIDVPEDIEIYNDSIPYFFNGKISKKG